jgi:hypothetical protein
MERLTIETLAAASFKEFLLKTQPSLPVDVFDVLRANQIWDLQRLLKVTKEACPDFYYAKHPPLNLSGSISQHQLAALLRPFGIRPEHNLHLAGPLAPKVGPLPRRMSRKRRLRNHSWGR